MPGAVIDQERAQAFAQRMRTLGNNAFLGIGLSVGHRTGLFDVMATLPPSSSEEIAAAAGLNERYVREWLGAMTVGQIVEYAPSDQRYRLPPEHGASLTRAAGLRTQARMAQIIALLAQVESEIVECFQTGGGLGYDRYPRFVQIMQEGPAARHDANLIDAVLPIVPGLTDRLRAGAELADVGCGSGRAVNLMAREFPNSRFTGYDLSQEALAAARAEAGAGA